MATFVLASERGGVRVPRRESPLFRYLLLPSNRRFLHKPSGLCVYWTLAYKNDLHIRHKRPLQDSGKSLERVRVYRHAVERNVRYVSAERTICRVPPAS
jgi:hypothetical protein